MNNKKQLKQIPVFKNEDEEREFWATADTSQYFDWDNAQEAIFPNLKPSTTTISLRLTQSMLDDIKIVANKQDVPYQSLMKTVLGEWVDRKLGRVNKSA